MPLGLPKAFAIDFDGVIADSMSSQENAWRSAAERVGVSESATEALVVNLYAGHAGPRMFEGIQFSEQQLKELRVQKDSIWAETSSDVRLFVDAKQVLCSLAAQVPLAVATTASRAYVETILVQNGLRGNFAKVVTNADVAAPKPAPDMLDHILSAFRIEATDCMMIGDSITDLRMAQAARMPFLGFGKGHWTTKPDLVAENWRDLARLFELDPPHIAI